MVLRFLKMFLIKYGVTQPLFLLQASLSGGNKEHLMAVKTLFSKGDILAMQDAS